MVFFYKDRYLFLVWFVFIVYRFLVSSVIWGFFECLNYGYGILFSILGDKGIFFREKGV